VAEADAASTGLEDAHPTRIELAIRRAAVAIGEGDFLSADRQAARAAEAARRAGLPALQARALRSRGIAAEKSGDLSLAEAMFSQAGLRAEVAGERAVYATCLEHLGTVARLRGDAEGSLAWLGRARQLFEEAGEVQGIADVQMELGASLSSLGRPAEAEQALRGAAEQNARLGNQAAHADCLNNLGEVLRARGEIDDAEVIYARAFAIGERLGAQGRVFPLLNLAQVRYARGRPKEAGEALRRALPLLSGRRALLAYAHACMLPAAGAAADWEAWDRHAETAELLLAETGLVDADIRACAESAARHAREVGDADRAAVAERIAQTQLPPRRVEA
jgi:tetratricopeptide (TPR) repeat protein